MRDFDIYVYPRIQSATETDVKDFSNSGRIHMCNAPVMNVSSTFIREAIKNRKDVRYLLTDPVFKYVDEMNFYK